MIRIAMWSGPRNISTAMMRSWGNRPDTVVCDEPLYAHYLLHVPVQHPGVDEVVATHDSDWRSVVRGLTEDEPAGAAIYYQKHMAHHLLPHIERDWLGLVHNCFLIREPRGMLASLSHKMGMPRLRDTGLEQQLEIFDMVRQAIGRVPPVIDSADVLRDPGRTLSELCRAIGVPFSETMLHWPPGRRETDGVWARYWYDAVEKSTGFEPYVPRTVTLPPELDALAEECTRYYDALAQYKIV